MHKAWKALKTEGNTQLIDLLADRVKDLCNYKPDFDTVAKFLNPNSSKQPPRPVVVPKSPAVPPIDVPPSKEFWFELEGTRYAARSAKDVMTKVFDALTARDPLFPKRFAALPKHGTKNRYLALTREELYTDRPDLRQNCTHELNSGSWIITNCSRVMIVKIIKMACEVARIQYEKELRINLGEKQV